MSFTRWSVKVTVLPLKKPISRDIPYCKQIFW